MKLITDDATIHSEEGGLPGRLTLGKLLLRFFTWEDESPENASAPYITARVAHFVHGVKADGHDAPDEELRDLIAQRQAWDVQFAAKRRELAPEAAEDWAHGEGEFDDSTRAPLWFAFDAYVTWVRHSSLEDIPGSLVNAANQIQNTGLSFLTVEEAMQASHEALASLDGINSFDPQPVAEALVIPPVSTGGAEAPTEEEAAPVQPVTTEDEDVTENEGGPQDGDEFVAEGVTVGDGSINSQDSPFPPGETEEGVPAPAVAEEETLQNQEVQAAASAEFPVSSEEEQLTSQGFDAFPEDDDVEGEGEEEERFIPEPEIPYSIDPEPYIAFYEVDMSKYLTDAENDQERPRS